MESSDLETEQVQVEVEESFYLFEENVKVFNIFKIIRFYLNEYYALGTSSALLLELIKENKLPLEQTLIDVPYIHSGYLSVVLPKGKDDGK